MDSARQSKIEGNLVPGLKEEHHSQIGKGDDEDRFGKVAASPNLKFLDVRSITVGARGSQLSQAQVWEVHRELIQHHPHVQFKPLWITTTGDQDKTTSLRHLDKTDFFTREVDQMQLQGRFRISIHSAKDLPEPLAPGLKIIALTQGVDPSDVLVYNGELQENAIIGTSSLRREEALRSWRSDLRFCDIRGTAEERLAILDSGKIDGLVMAEAALIRLGLTHRKRTKLSGETAQLQGRLAVIALDTDREMEELFQCLNLHDADKTALSRNRCS